MADSMALNDGTNLPAIGLGLYKVKPAEVMDTVTSAVEIGYRLIDGAAFYHNERELGEAIRYIAGEFGVPRSDLVIASKFWGDPVQSYDQALRDFDQTMSDLGLDVLDLYYIHWPRPGRDAYVDVWRALIRLQDEGRVRSIAVSNFNEGEITRLLAETGVVPAVNQIESHPWLPQLELRAFHAERDIVTQAWSPLGRGQLLDDPTLVAIGSRYGVSPAQVVLRWHRQMGGAAIPKSTHAERQRQNLDLDGFVLEAKEITAIASLTNGRHTGSTSEART